jgi:uncharacterized protein with GYD domain
MIFIVLTKWKQPPTKDMKPQMEQWTKTREELERQGIKITAYWTLGRYDAVSIMEAPSEKDVMKILLPFQQIIDTETLVAIPRDEAIELV